MPAFQCLVSTFRAYDSYLYVFSGNKYISDANYNGIISMNKSEIPN